MSKKKPRKPFPVRIDQAIESELEALAQLEEEKTGKRSFSARIAYRALLAGLPIVRQEICDEFATNFSGRTTAEKLAIVSKRIHEAGIKVLFPNGLDLDPIKIDQFIAAEQAA